MVPGGSGLIGSPMAESRKRTHVSQTLHGTTIGLPRNGQGWCQGTMGRHIWAVRPGSHKRVVPGMTDQARVVPMAVPNGSCLGLNQTFRSRSLRRIDPMPVDHGPELQLWTQRFLSPRLHPPSGRPKLSPPFLARSVQV